MREHMEHHGTSSNLSRRVAFGGAAGVLEDPAERAGGRQAAGQHDPVAGRSEPALLFRHVSRGFSRFLARFAPRAVLCPRRPFQANLSMTVLNELRELQVAKVLLQLVADRNISEQGKSVAERLGRDA